MLRVVAGYAEGGWARTGPSKRGKSNTNKEYHIEFILFLCKMWPHNIRLYSPPTQYDGRCQTLCADAREEVGQISGVKIEMERF